MALTHYIVIRRDMTFGEYSGQLAHAGEAYYMLAESGHRMRFNSTFTQVKGARNESRLLWLHQKLLRMSVPHVAIVETDGRLAGQLTLISLMPAEFEDNHPVHEPLNEFHRINQLDGPA